MEPADAALHRTLKMHVPSGTIRHRIVLNEEEDKYFRREPLEFLKGIGIDMPLTHDEEIQIVELRTPGSAPHAAGDCYRVKCYDLYCCPPYLISFDCIVCEEQELALNGAFRVATV
jgi:hypothetical protein